MLKNYSFWCLNWALGDRKGDREAQTISFALAAIKQVESQTLLLFSDGESGEESNYRWQAGSSLPGKVKQVSGYLTQIE